MSKYVYMTIPLDRLYHFIENNVKETFTDPIIIYRFSPHGSKNIVDLTALNSVTWAEHIMNPKLLCFDQEPTNIEFYNNPPNADNLIFESLGVFSQLDGIKFGGFRKNIFLHSEQRFINQDEDNFIPVYYWSHAIIARDWFRYAEFETFQKNTQKTFLIYNRSWSGYREYRIKFTDLLVKYDLIPYCQTTFNAIDAELNLHYANHKFANEHWKSVNRLENYLQPTVADATSSADFVTKDYNSTDIEVVLETLFDHNQLHLTEKSLRPIACGQPFILAGTHGSLEYLRSYGFKTFGQIWNEHYDLVEDPQERMLRIIELMREIANWSPDQRANKLVQARAIAEYNRQYFFSQKFFDLVVNELKQNLKAGLSELKDYCDNFDWHALVDYYDKEILSNPELVDTYIKKTHMNQNREGLILMRDFMRKKAGLDL